MQSGEATRTPPRQAPSESFAQCGLGANKPPRWSAERRASPGAQTVKASLRGDARTYVTGPLLKRVPPHPAPVGAPPPHFAFSDTSFLLMEVHCSRFITD